MTYLMIRYRLLQIKTYSKIKNELTNLSKMIFKSHLSYLHIHADYNIDYTLWIQYLPGFSRDKSKSNKEPFSNPTTRFDSFPGL